MPRPRDPVCPHALQRSLDLPVRFSWREVGPHDGVVVVDGAVPYGPAHPPVVAKVGLDRAPESEQEFHAVLLDSPGGIRATAPRYSASYRA